VGDVMDMGGSRSAGKSGRGSRKAAEPQGSTMPASPARSARRSSGWKSRCSSMHGSGVRAGGSAAGPDPAAAQRVDRELSALPGARRWLIWRRLRRLYQGFRHPDTPGGPGGW
jgi:hypothetical protein